VHGFIRRLSRSLAPGLGQFDWSTSPLPADPDRAWLEAMLARFQPLPAMCGPQAGCELH
jgi:hypothetical protein